MDEGRRQRFIHIAGFILALAAGWVDTLGVYVFLGENSPFLTGRVVKLGKYLVSGETKKMLAVLILVAAFTSGAVLATLLTKKRGLAAGLGLTGLLLILTPFLARPASFDLALLTIPLAMGAQNAATSLTGINRTTHLTGPTTDIGIYLAQGDWKMARFWSLRWLAFFLGVVSSYLLLRLTGDSKLALYLMLLPGLAISLTACGQKFIFRIPLLDSSGEDGLP